MQNKITSILLLILYITTNVGYSLDMHYMDGKLMNSDCKKECKMQSNNINKKHFAHTLQEHIAWMEQNNQKDTGCSDHEIQIKIDAPQLSSKQEIVNVPFLPVQIAANYLESIFLFDVDNNHSSENRIEKILSSVPIYITFQRLIFYS